MEGGNECREVGISIEDYTWSEDRMASRQGTRCQDDLRVTLSQHVLKIVSGSKGIECHSNPTDDGYPEKGRHPFRTVGQEDGNLRPHAYPIGDEATSNRQGSVQKCSIRHPFFRSDDGFAFGVAGRNLLEEPAQGKRSTRQHRIGGKRRPVFY